jgi:hypothetical protein
MFQAHHFERFGWPPTTKSTKHDSQVAFYPLSNSFLLVPRSLTRSCSLTTVSGCSAVASDTYFDWRRPERTAGHPAIARKKALACEMLESPSIASMSGVEGSQVLSAAADGVFLPTSMLVSCDRKPICDCLRRQSAFPCSSPLSLHEILVRYSSEAAHSIDLCWYSSIQECRRLMSSTSTQMSGIRFPMTDSTPATTLCALGCPTLRYTCTQRI